VSKILLAQQVRIILAAAPNQNDAGIMEYWNTGIMMPFQKTQYSNSAVVASLLRRSGYEGRIGYYGEVGHSRFPRTPRPANPLGMRTHGDQQ